MFCFQVWVSFAQFELSLSDDDAVKRARQVYEKGCQELKLNTGKEERLALLEAWKEFEVSVYLEMGEHINLHMRRDLS